MKYNRILILIVIAQFLATSVWFAGNAIYSSLQVDLGLSFDLAPKLTVAVQWGFIIGTLVYAIAMIPDRYSPAKVFFSSTILAAISNLLILLPLGFEGIYITRFLVGFFLAGIYPVGMKIVTDWFLTGAGKSLGFLVGALVLGTSLPHFIKSQSIGFSWEIVIITTSLLAVLSGFIVYRFVGDGPFRKKANAFSLQGFFSIFKNKMINRASFGYFGHMRELYAFWAFTPIILAIFNEVNQTSINVPLWTFIIIGVGAIGCVIGGSLSKQYGSCRIAFFAMVFSASCALLSILFFGFNEVVFLGIMLIWGFFVVMDSPQFSSVIADYSEKEYVGSTLTIVNSIGFGITIVSIQLVAFLVENNQNFFWVLAIGPILGLYPTSKVAFRANFPEL